MAVSGLSKRFLAQSCESRWLPYHHFPCNDAAALILKIIARKKLAAQGIAVIVQEQLLPQS